jgi:phosphatidylglycerophosphate synthase
LRRQLGQAGALLDASRADRIVLVRADWAYDDMIMRGLVRADSDVALAGTDGSCVALNVSASRIDEARTCLETGVVPEGVPRATAEEIASSYNVALRKKELPYLMKLTAGDLPAIEKRIFGGAYKGVTDLVTRYVWPAPARAATRMCAHAGITPNQVTAVGLLLVLLANWMFWHGNYVAGLLAAWLMTFLDTVDGKLARATLTSSRFVNIFDHGIDLVHPPFWWWAWVVGLTAAGHQLEAPGLVLTIIVAGYILQRVEEGLFAVWFGMDMHVWRRFDSVFRLVTARRNPNLVILTFSVLLERPDLGILAVAWWTAFSFLVHAVRITQAALARRHGPLQSWLAS